MLKIDKDIIGGITSSLISIISSVGMRKPKIDVITYNYMKLHYYYDKILIICVETIKDIQEPKIKKIIKEIHSKFLKRYSKTLEKRTIVNIQRYKFFKKEILKILIGYKMIPEFKSLNLSKNFLQRVEDLLLDI